MGHTQIWLFSCHAAGFSSYYFQFLLLFFIIVVVVTIVQQPEELEHQWLREYHLVAKGTVEVLTVHRDVSVTTHTHMHARTETEKYTSTCARLSVLSFSLLPFSLALLFLFSYNQQNHDELSPLPQNKYQRVHMRIFRLS